MKKQMEATIKLYKVASDLNTVDALYLKIQECTDADNPLKPSMFRRSVAKQVPIFKQSMSKIYALKSKPSSMSRGEAVWSYTRNGGVLDKMWCGVYSYLEKNKKKKNPTILDNNKHKCAHQFLKAIGFLIEQVNVISNIDILNQEGDTAAEFEKINPQKFSSEFKNYKLSKKSPAKPCPKPKD